MYKKPQIVNSVAYAMHMLKDIDDDCNSPSDLAYLLDRELALKLVEEYERNRQRVTDEMETAVKEKVSEEIERGTFFEEKDGEARNAARLILELGGANKQLNKKSISSLLRDCSELKGILHVLEDGDALKFFSKNERKTLREKHTLAISRILDAEDDQGQLNRSKRTAKLQKLLEEVKELENREEEVNRSLDKISAEKIDLERAIEKKRNLVQRVKEKIIEEGEKGRKSKAKIEKEIASVEASLKNELREKQFAEDNLKLSGKGRFKGQKEQAESKISILRKSLGSYNVVLEEATKKSDITRKKLSEILEREEAELQKITATRFSKEKAFEEVIENLTEAAKEVSQRLIDKREEMRAETDQNNSFEPGGKGEVRKKLVEAFVQEIKKEKRRLCQLMGFLEENLKLIKENNKKIKEEKNKENWKTVKEVSDKSIELDKANRIILLDIDKLEDRMMKKKMLAEKYKLGKDKTGTIEKKLSAVRTIKKLIKRKIEDNSLILENTTLFDMLMLDLGILFRTIVRALFGLMGHACTIVYRPLLKIFNWLSNGVSRLAD